MSFVEPRHHFSVDKPYEWAVEFKKLLLMEGKIESNKFRCPYCKIRYITEIGRDLLGRQTIVIINTHQHHANCEYLKQLDKLTYFKPK